MTRRFASIFAYAAVLGVTRVASAQTGNPFPVPPRFIDSPYAVTVDLSKSDSFSFTSSAVDDNSGDIVTITGLGGLYFSRFSTTPGNPATFTFGGEGIRERGIYDFRFFAIDNSQLRLQQSTTFRLTILPEPTELISVGLVSLFFKRKRRALVLR